MTTLSDFDDDSYDGIHTLSKSDLSFSLNDTKCMNNRSKGFTRFDYLMEIQTPPKFIVYNLSALHRIFDKRTLRSSIPLMSIRLKHRTLKKIVKPVYTIKLLTRKE